MHENNFEDQVHNKMQQLGFDPSEAVWTAVEKEINRDKKRRKPLLIIFFLSGLLLGGVGIYFVLMKNSSDKIIAAQISKDHGETNNKPSVRSGQSAKLQTNTTTKTITNKNDQDDAKNANVQTGTNANDRNIKMVPKANQSNGSALMNAENKDAETNTIQNANHPAKQEPDNTIANTYDSSGLKKNTASVMKKDFPKDSLSDPKKATHEKSKISLWKIEFTGGIGFSDIHQSLFKQSYNTGLYAFTPANGSNASTAPVPAASEINTGFSFVAGVDLKRNLSKHISISAGLNYHFYSTHIHTGYAVDSSVTVYYNAAFSASSPSYLANGFYQNGVAHNYTNQYHFIELPVSVNFQLNKSKKLPVYWEAGLSLSYLIGTNALFFDPNGNLYYQNRDLFNKTQLSGTTSLLIGIPVHKNELQLGPQLQYGFTGLLKSGTTGSEHMFYGGLKISYVLPWK
jgi:Outer membrane protein beta-barrel domain